MKTVIAFLAAAMLLCGCQKSTAPAASAPVAEFTNSYNAELEQRMALIEVGWWEAQRAQAGDVTASLYEATNREVREFKAMMFDRQHSK